MNLRMTLCPSATVQAVMLLKGCANSGTSKQPSQPTLVGQ